MTDSQALLPSSNKQIQQKKTAAIWPLWLFIVILLVANIGTASYFWLAFDKQNHRIVSTDAEKSKLDQRVKQMEQSVAMRFRKLEDAETKQSSLLTTLDKQALFNTRLLNQLHSSNRADWVLAEAEYLLRLANQRLSIENDVKGAEAILISADKVLAENNDPGLLPVRIKLAEEILALQTIPTSDIDGLYVKLEALTDSLEKLDEIDFQAAREDLAAESTLSASAQVEELDGLRLLWHEIWSDLKKAVVIRRLDQPAEPLLAPKQSYYLKQNLRLMLEQASLALLDKNQATFQSSLRKASRWIKNYFSVNESRSQAMLEALSQLENTKITYEKPDISNSLRLLKAKIEAMYRSHQLDRYSSGDGQTEAGK